MSAAKEYAQELLEKFLPYVDTHHDGSFANAKRCALVALDEIYKNNTDMSKNDYLCRVAEELNKL